MPSSDRRNTGSAAQPEHFGFDQLVEEQGGFHLLAEEAGEELVLGFIGRWWDRGYGRVEWSAECQCSLKGRPVSLLEK
jgi:hypothetical protein